LIASLLAITLFAQSLCKTTLSAVHFYPIPSAGSGKERIAQLMGRLAGIPTERVEKAEKGKCQLYFPWRWMWLRSES
jgi:hypothetical protein